jgi:hypothetical protein
MRDEFLQVVIIPGFFDTPMRMPRILQNDKQRSNFTAVITRSSSRPSFRFRRFLEQTRVAYNGNGNKTISCRARASTLARGIKAASVRPPVGRLHRLQSPQQHAQKQLSQFIGRLTPAAERELSTAF